jgi:hypothetical protein
MASSFSVAARFVFQEWTDEMRLATGFERHFAVQEK